MKIESIGKINKFECDSCNEYDKELNRIEFEESEVSTCLCDECLQELNRKIVDYLVDKNI
ncbi:MAG: hypothetical protein ACRC7S_05510 [Cetobacterium sp.]